VHNVHKVKADNAGGGPDARWMSIALIAVAPPQIVCFEGRHRLFANERTA
jgi:hypothetical protein